MRKSDDEIRKAGGRSRVGERQVTDCAERVDLIRGLMELYPLARVKISTYLLTTLDVT